MVRSNKEKFKTKTPRRFECSTREHPNLNAVSLESLYLSEAGGDMSTSIKRGSKGSNVKLCQERLILHGYATTVDGVFGAGTEALVMQFQRARGLTPDGIVGASTWQALLAAPITQGISSYAELDDLSRRILAEIAWYVGWGYATGSQPSFVAQPSRLAPANVVWGPGQKTRTVCCVFVAGIVGRVFDRTAKWTSTAWSRFMVPATEPWGMLTECVAAEIGTAFTGTPQPGKWYVVQGWNHLEKGKVVAKSRGHQWLQWGPNLMVEANVYTDQDADGSLTDPGAVAWRHQAWVPQSARYQEIRLVELKP